HSASSACRTPIPCARLLSVFYTLSLHAALPIFKRQDTPETDIGWTTLRDRRLGYLVVRRNRPHEEPYEAGDEVEVYPVRCGRPIDRKSTRLNSSHVKISYAVFCLKKQTMMPK